MKKEGKMNWKYTLVAVMIAGTLLASMTVQFPDEIITETGQVKSWNTLMEGALGDNLSVPAGASGMLCIYFAEHMGNASTYWNVNRTNYTGGNVHVYGTADYDDQDGGGGQAGGFRTDIRHTDTFDIIVKVRVNRTHGYNSTTTEWCAIVWNRCNVTSNDLISAVAWNLTTPDHSLNISSADSYDFVWMHFIYTNAGAGFSIARDNESRITTIRYQAYY